MAKPAVPRFLVSSVCWESSTEVGALVARRADQYGAPVPGPPTLARADAPRVFTAHTTALLRWPFRSLSSVTAAIYTRVHGVTWRQRSHMTMWTILIKVLLFASRTGCEQRTLERPPSFQAVLQCAQSVGRRESCQAGGSRQLPSDKPWGSQSPWTRPTGLGWKARTLSRPLGDHTQSQN